MTHYKSTIVGRIKEQDYLNDCNNSGKAEFIAVYGRRRVGKTYLVKNFYEEKFDFYTSGIYGLNKKDQLKNFSSQLARYSGHTPSKFDDWFDAFNALRDYLGTLKDKERIIVFIDELPWHDTPKSNFTRALEGFWNMWGADQHNLKLIVCGSATTWMTNKLLGDKGGLHNRVTRRIKLNSFSLKETESFLQSIGIEWDRQQIMDAYMALGGTPFYLNLLKKDKSIIQNIDYLFFSEDAPLRDEYNLLYRSLFNDAVTYRRITELLSNKGKGLTRKEIVTELKLTDSGKLTEILENLESCDFIRSYSAFGKNTRDILYQLNDLYILFYYRFVKGSKNKNEHTWSEMSDGKRNAWAGLAFEQLCLRHIAQIKDTLGIDGISSDVCSWTYSDSNQCAQIDLVIDRSDRIINLCEMKYCSDEYEITKEYDEKLQRRKELFRSKVKTTKTLHLTMVSPNGIKLNKYSGKINSQIMAKDLFCF